MKKTQESKSRVKYMKFLSSSGLIYILQNDLKENNFSQGSNNLTPM